MRFIAPATIALLCCGSGANAQSAQDLADVMSYCISVVGTEDRSVADAPENGVQYELRERSFGWRCDVLDGTQADMTLAAEALIPQAENSPLARHPFGAGTDFFLARFCVGGAAVNFVVNDSREDGANVGEAEIRRTPAHDIVCQ